jgi:hypothetical protein
MKNALVILCVVAIGFVVGWFVMRPKTVPQIGIFQKTIPIASPTPEKGTYNPIEVPVTGVQTQNGETKGGVRVPNIVATETLISYKDDGFHEPVVYVKLGSTVVFKNESNKDMWVASAPHPAHSAYPEFDQKKSVARGGSYSFVFTKVGSWKFHNHMMPDQTGTVVVQQ